jgi:hypothetical protein
VDGGLFALVAFINLGRLEPAIIPIMGRIMPAAFLKKLLRVNASSFSFVALNLEISLSIIIQLTINRKHRTTRTTS